MGNYVLSFDPLMTSPPLSTLQQYIKDSRYIDSWHSPWLGLYLLKSDQAPFDLQENLRGLFNTSMFLLAHVRADVTGGYMSQIVWQWFNDGTLPSLPEWNPK